MISATQFGWVEWKNNNKKKLLCIATKPTLSDKSDKAKLEKYDEYFLKVIKISEGDENFYRPTKKKSGIALSDKV